MRCARDLLGKCSRRSRCGWELPSEHAGEKEEVRKEDPRLPDRSKKVSAGQTGSPRARISRHRSLESNRYGRHVSAWLTHLPTELGSQTVDAVGDTPALHSDSICPTCNFPTANNCISFLWDFSCCWTRFAAQEVGPTCQRMNVPQGTALNQCLMVTIQITQ